MRAWRGVVTLGLLLLLAVPGPARAAGGTGRRVNAPRFSGPVDWARSAIFWFGKNEVNNRLPPGRNYVDVRVAYNDEGLWLHVNVVDYWLWYRPAATATDDLTQYDGIALYLDTNHDRRDSPGSDDYYYLSAYRDAPEEAGPRYRRAARGNGSGWDSLPPTVLSDTSAAQWSCNPGPNNNDCTIDFGWVNTFVVPWSALGRGGPPPDGTVYGLGMVLYDRDDNPPAGAVPPQAWPETFDAGHPATWGELAFSPAPYRPPAAVQSGQRTYRRGYQGSMVADAWIGGGGLCASGHEGGSEVNHGADEHLFTGSETQPTHFPCFNRTYLRFDIGDIPPGKVILSARLILHHWGNADPAKAQPSWVHLFTVADPWDEMSLHWNNAPLAVENVAASLVPAFGPGVEVPWPGVAREWDATQAVAEAYAAGRPVSLALYASDSEQHSSKYYTSSEQGDWNAESRPALSVVWGDPAATPIPDDTPLHLPLVALWR